MQLLHLDMSVIFQSTPSAWRETHAIVRVDAPNYISIHSLRMEGDCRSPIAALRILHFNPLPPHGGRLCDLVLFSPLYISFQSTPSAWRETPYLSETHPTQSFQSTPSAWRETIGLALPPSVGSVFQSTPSAWRETRSHCTSSIMPGYFNPLPPHGGRRYQDIMYDRNRNISIHSLRMEGDSTKRKQQELDRKISIHSLRMEGDYPAQPG